MYWNYVGISILGLGGWLTLTWDVLKSRRLQQLYRRNPRLTLTWDVLKYIQKEKLLSRWWRLTLTWDVLK